MLLLLAFLMLTQQLKNGDEENNEKEDDDPDHIGAEWRNRINKEIQRGGKYFIAPFTRGDSETDDNNPQAKTPWIRNLICFVHDSIEENQESL